MGTKYKIWLKKLVQFWPWSWPRPRESWPWPRPVLASLIALVSAHTEALLKTPMTMSHVCYSYIVVAC